MRRVLLVNALIFAVLAAAVALAYYGYSYTSEVSSNERELAVLQELADDKVLDIESRIESADNKLLAGVQTEPMSDLRELVKTTGAAATSVFVLDDHLKLLPDGSVSTRLGKLGIEFRDKFLTRIVPALPLAKQPVGKRGHMYGTWDGRPYLFSFMKRVVGERTFYVVIEDDLIHLVNNVFPQFFSVSLSSKRLFQVRDETGALRYGVPFVDTAGQPVQETRFVSTVDGWVLRVTQKDLPDPGAERRQLIDSLLIGGAVTIILAGLTVLGLAIRRERRLNELKSEFISNVSHELKTPLSIISMFGEMLAEGRTKSKEQAHEYAEIIWRESVRLGRLIDNVLDFARIERGMSGYEFAETDLAEVLDRAIELSARRVAAADMTLEVDIEPDLPVLQLDANAFTLAVLNLIDNAIKYAADGKTIALAVHRQGDRVVVTVRDWGPGIDPEEHERIFDRFYRARAIRLKPIRGSGIGLALVQHIARAHGGDASVSSTVGNGSTFRIRLPIGGK
ncbi:MAG TPA: HAMP domain-containing sensor histidine kinase [Kofleriaceae bacterium]|nr:HAMP domain-containing sensor histidine kinase [Kofleriaceae bacterium]